MRIDRTLMFSLIRDFGFQKECELIQAGDNHNAYQYRAARVDLMYVLCTGTILDCKRMLNSLVDYSINETGYWIYDGVNFVTHKEAREELIKLRDVIELLEGAKPEELPIIMKDYRKENQK